MSKRTRRFFFTLPVLVVVVLLVLFMRFPLFVKMPLVVVARESFDSLRGTVGWVYYVHKHLALLRWNERTGVRDFDATLAELQASEDPDRFALGKLEWHRGDFAAAVSHIEAYHRENRETETSLFWLAMSYLRLGEAQNCLDRLVAENATDAHMAHLDHQQMCALPLLAYHEREDASRRAAKAFEKLLVDYDPDKRVYQWLLNFSYMTIDAFPDEVPLAYRIESSFIDHFHGEKKREMAEKYAYLRLEDRAKELGVATLDVGKGVAVEDFDRDGYLDIITGGSYSPTRYYWNNRGTGFVDKSQESGVATMLMGAHIATAADYDNDGWVDALIGSPFGIERGGVALLHNDGDGTFSDRTAAMGLEDPEFIMPWASAWGDIDNDGDLDLFLASWGFYNAASYELKSNPFANNVSSRLYRNDQSRFVDVTDEWGLEPSVQGLNVFGASFGDYNADGFTDLAITPQWLPGIVLFENQAGTGFEKTDLVPSDSWGFMTAFVDVNHDGRLDLYVGGTGSSEGVTAQAVFGERDDSFHTETAIWLQTEKGRFEKHEEFFSGRMPLATMGSNFGDLNNDGAYDFYLGTGNPEGWMVLPNLMYMGRKENGVATGEMDNVSMLNGVGTIQKGHGIVFFDFDEDGDQDIYSSLGGLWPADKWPNQLFVNESELDAAWTKIRLRGRKSNYYGAGARIKVVTRNETGQEQALYYHMDNQSGFGSAPYLAHVGLADATEIDRIEVVWPGETGPKLYSGKLRETNLLDEDAGTSTLEPLRVTQLDQ